MDLKKVAAALLLLAASAAEAGATDPMRGLARELAEAARAAGLRRVAVSQLDSSRGRDDGEGALLTERLTTALVRSGKVQAVERSMLPKLMEERSLARTGALELDSTENSRFARVDAVVMGTFHASGKSVRIVVRVVDYRTGVIVGAAEGELEREGGSVISDVDPYVAPAPIRREPYSERAETPRDSVADPAFRCADAASRADSLEEEILEIKARYWAIRLKAGLSGAELRDKPGSTIVDPALKRRFSETLRRWYNAARVPALSEEEVSRFVRADGEAYALHQECRF